MASDTFPPLKLGPREIPVPTSVSPLARKTLGNVLAANDYPATAEGWRAFVAEMDRRAEAQFFPYTLPSKVEQIGRIYRGVPDKLPNPALATLFFHGGAFLFCSGRTCEFYAALESARYGQIAYSVDFRLPPDHPYPAGLDDCLEAYRFVLERHQPSQIAFYGRSSGGNLAAATLLRAQAEGLPTPGCLVLDSPHLDLTESGDTFATNAEVDIALRRGMPEVNALYANGADLSHPYLSPLFGDVSKFPPTLLLSGTRDLFLSNAVRLHRALRKAGRVADLHVWEAMPHGGYNQSAPESQEMRWEIGRFMRSHLR